MIVIFKNIPTRTKKLDIKNFITPVVNGGWFDKKGTVINISILVQRNLRTREIVYHGLVEIEPDSVGIRLITKLNRKILLGKYIAVSEYHVRNFRNDPRLRKRRPKPGVLERRICDRRDKYEILSEAEINLEGKRAFHSKGW
ncbi:hypothetical protein DOJK_01137 [Patescibacteria group bacterium]|nr:hypothetical protein DOJK_01137 [Patescibacteria group bacterium]